MNLLLLFKLNFKILLCFELIFLLCFELIFLSFIKVVQSRCSIREKKSLKAKGRIKTNVSVYLTGWRREVSKKEKTVTLCSQTWQREAYKEEKTVTLYSPAWPMGISIKMDSSNDLRKVILKEWNKKKEE